MRMCLMMCLVPLFGQDLEEMTLEELLKVEVVGPTRFPMTLADVPQSVTVYTSRDIQKIGALYVSDLLNYVPGFQSYVSADGPHQIAFSSRGRRIGPSSAEVLLLIDGQRVADPRTGGSGNVLSYFPLADVQQVEFIRGAGSALYGSNAMMGVINIITKKHARQAQIAIGGNGKGEAGVQFHGRSSLNLSFHVYDDHGQSFDVPDSFSDQTVSTRDSRSHAHLRAHWTRGDFQLKVLGNYTKGDDFYTAGFVSDFNKATSDLFQVNSEYHLKNSWFDSFFGLMFSQTKNQLNTQLTGMGDLLPVSNPPSEQPFLVEADFVGRGIEFYWRGFKKQDRFTWQWGVEARHADLVRAEAKSNYDLVKLTRQDYPLEYRSDFSFRAPINLDMDEWFFGVFAQGHFKLNQWISMLLGIRWDDYELGGNNVSPRAALVWTPQPNHQIKLLAGEAFRAPSFTERGIINNPVFSGNMDLGSESSSSFELIYHRRGQKSSLFLSYFEHHFDHAIVQQTTAGVRTFANLNEKPSKGAELEGHYSFGKIQLKIGGSYLFEQPQYSFREADSLAYLLLHYQKEKWGFHLSDFWHSQRSQETASGFQKLDSYSLLSGKVSRQFSDKHIVWLEGSNLFDSDFQTPSQTVGSWLDQGLPNRGRSWSLRYSYDF